MKDLKNKTASGFVYKFAERVGAQGISFVISMILARLLLPEEYGVIALVTVIISLLDVFVTYGFGNSLVANKNSDHLDFSTCFYFGLGLAVIVYGLTYLSAPLLGKFYDNELLVPVVRVMALKIPLAGINSVQHAYVSKHMMFRKFFYATLIGTVISGVVAVVMAYAGMGVWALVEQYLGNSAIDTLCLWIIVGWRPRLEFSLARLKAIYQYGWKILAVGLIDTGYRELRSLVIGKKYSKADLAYYNKGMQFPAFSNKLIEPTINTVLFPSLSSCNDDRAMMLSITRRMIKVSTFILAPIMIGLAAVGKPLVELLLTSKWDDCIIYLQIGCIAYLLRPLQIINNSVIKSSGNSALLLKLDILKKIIGIVLMLVSMPFGTLWIAVSYALTNIIAAFINIGPNTKILGYSYKKQFLDIIPNYIVALLMGFLVWTVSLMDIRPLFQLLIQVPVGVVAYVALSKLFRIDSFEYLWKFVKKNGKRGLMRKLSKKK